MTTYAIRITLNEGTELTMMTEALELYIQHCQSEVEQGREQVVWSKLKAAKRIKSSLYSNLEQTSGNNFFRNLTEKS
jgi:hypothetical protein